MGEVYRSRASLVRVAPLLLFVTLPVTAGSWGGGIAIPYTRTIPAGAGVGVSGWGGGPSALSAGTPGSSNGCVLPVTCMCLKISRTLFAGIGIAIMLIHPAKPGIPPALRPPGSALRSPSPRGVLWALPAFLLWDSSLFNRVLIGGRVWAVEPEGTRQVGEDRSRWGEQCSPPPQACPAFC